MNSNDIVVSLDVAKRLRDAGYPQDDAVFYWLIVYFQDEPSKTCLSLHNQALQQNTNERWASPTAEEILKLLPDMIEKTEDGEELQVLLGFNAKWSVSYDSFIEFERDSLANAAAEMWIWLKQNDLLPS